MYICTCKRKIKKKEANNPFNLSYIYIKQQQLKHKKMKKENNKSRFSLSQQNIHIFISTKKKTKKKVKFFNSFCGYKKKRGNIKKKPIKQMNKRRKKEEK